MALSPLADIRFDEQDANLFLVDDARLRADALKHSVLPRLRILMNAAITLIDEIYELEVLSDSIVSSFPNFREKRYKDNELVHQYDAVFVGLGGQRKEKWTGFSRKDRKPVQIVPFRFAFVLMADGVFNFLENGWLKGLDRESFESILRFHIDNEEMITRLCFAAKIRPEFYSAQGLPYFASFQEHYENRISNRQYDNHFVGHTYGYPVKQEKLEDLIQSFAFFFPVYDSYIQMAKGLPHRLDLLINKLNHWFEREWEVAGVAQEVRPGSVELAALAARFAEQKTRVMPAMRWQVFQRDKWRCVSCGASSHDGAILHVDHIIPRSHGGLDKLDNFQTLCNFCNIGKSNRDSTDLRAGTRVKVGKDNRG